jgi:hypothetical protein
METLPQFTVGSTRKETYQNLNTYVSTIQDYYNKMQKEIASKFGLKGLAGSSNLTKLGAALSGKNIKQLTSTDYPEMQRLANEYIQNQWTSKYGDTPMGNASYEELTSNLLKKAGYDITNPENLRVAKNKEVADYNNSPEGMAQEKSRLEKAVAAGVYVNPDVLKKYGLTNKAGTVQGTSVGLDKNQAASNMALDQREAGMQQQNNQTTTQPTQYSGGASMVDPMSPEYKSLSQGSYTGNTLKGLDAASIRILNGRPEGDDVKNVEYAKSKGYVYVPNPAMGYVTNNQAGGQTSGGSTGMTNTGGGSTYQTNAALEKVVADLPMLAEDMNDANFKSAFYSMDPTLQMALIQVYKSHQTAVEQGKVVNPNIELEPAMVEQFRKQAISELDPYYQEQIGNYEQDLKRSLSRMQQDYLTSVGRTEEAFKLQIKQQADDEAQAGMAFSSGRVDRLNRAITGQQENLDDATKQLARQQQDQAIEAERQLGSRRLGEMGLQTGVNQYTVGEQGFTGAGTRNLFTPQGNLMGDVNKSREVDLNARQNELITNEKQQRILDFSALGGGNSLAAARSLYQLTPTQSSDSPSSYTINPNTTSSTRTLSTPTTPTSTTPSPSDTRYWSQATTDVAPLKY